MDLKNIVQKINQMESATQLSGSGRRDLLKKLGSSLAAAAIPAIITALPETATAQTSGSNSDMINTMNYLLELEYFVYNYFRTGCQTGGLMPAADLPGFQAVVNHDLGHINTLSAAITNLGGTPYLPKYYDNNPFCPAAYDFTAGGVYMMFYSANYGLFLNFAQIFKDLVARAYVNSAPIFTGNAALLTQLMQMHSVDSRHAAHSRLVRRYFGQAADNPKPWITNNNSVASTPPNEFEAYYNGENNTIQAAGTGAVSFSLDISQVTGIGGTIPLSAATEAFDEPLPQATVQALIAPFLVS